MIIKNQIKILLLKGDEYSLMKKIANCLPTYSSQIKGDLVKFGRLMSDINFNMYHLIIKSEFPFLIIIF